jgi:hypothetical protein
MPQTFAPGYKGRPVDTSATAFGELVRSDAESTDAAGLRGLLVENGYLFLPQLLDRRDVMSACHEVLGRLQRMGLLADGSAIEEGVAKEGVSSSSAHDVAKDSPALDRLIYGPEILGFFTNLLGGPVRHFDFTWLRAKTPGQDTATEPHCDNVFMGRGSRGLLTAWTPLGDCPMEMGGLVILEGSHQQPKVHGYAELDVDIYCSNGPDAAAIERGDILWDSRANGGVLGEDAIAVREQLGGRWLTTNFKAGDLLVFTMFTVHASLDNQSDRFRLSSDSRYQLAAEPIDKRWVGESPPGHGPRGKKAMIC